MGNGERKQGHEKQSNNIYQKKNKNCGTSGKHTKRRGCNKPPREKIPDEGREGNAASFVLRRQRW